MPRITVIGVVPNEGVAGQLIGNLRLAGFPQDDISLLMADHEEDVDESLTDDRKQEGLAIVGGNATKGAALGTAAGLLAGFGTLALPGIGPVIGTGVLLAMFGGMGGVIGGLLGLYSSETEATAVIERYGMALQEGQAVVAVTVPDTETAQDAEQTFRAAGAVNINSYMEDQSSLGDQPGITDKTE